MMLRRTLSVLCLTSAAFAQAAQEAPRPNILLILCDDMGWSDVGCYGGEVRTPNIDRLAAEGLLFTQFYNNAKCTTTRASIVTGLYPRQDGKLLRPSMITVGELLKEAGYQTALIGKWHLGSKPGSRPIDRGFDEFYGLLDGCCNYFDPVQPDPAFKGGRVRVFADGDERVEEFEDGFYTTDAFSDRAVESIHRMAEDDAPFFLHLCYTAPHYPLHALPEDIERYDGKYDDGWEALRTRRHQRQIEMGLIDEAWNLPQLEPEANTWESAKHKDWQSSRMEVYAAMIDRMDQGIGRVLSALDDVGRENDTLVMFLSDNGGCAEIPGGEKPERIPGPKEHYTTCGPGWANAQNTPFRRYKQWVHEGGIATPFVARWPGTVPSGAITKEVGHIIDLLPTFADLAGVVPPEELDGRELLPIEGKTLRSVLAGGTREEHQYLYWAFAGNRAVRHGRWKLAWDRRVGAWELYDLVADRTEMQNLAAKKPPLLWKLSAAWEAWADRTGVRR